MIGAGCDVGERYHQKLHNLPKQVLIAAREAPPLSANDPGMRSEPNLQTSVRQLPCRLLLEGWWLNCPQDLPSPAPANGRSVQTAVVASLLDVVRNKEEGV